MFFQVLALARTALNLRKNKTPTNASQPRKPRSRSANLRLLAILPVLCSAIALLLSVLCVFAGHKPDMMEDYAVFTLNTSRIGENMLQNLDDKIRAIHLKRSGPVFLSVPTATATPTITSAPTTMITIAPRNILSDATSAAGKVSSAVHSVESAVSSKATSTESHIVSAATSAVGAAETNIINAVNKAYAGLISDLDLQDFYSIHISGSCTGTYVFQNGTNVTVGDSGLPSTTKGKHSVTKHVDTCSPHSAIDPMSLIRILYWIGIVFTGIAHIVGIAGIVLLPSRGRKMSLINILVTIPAFMFLGLASAVTHGLSLGATKLINFIGADIGIAGYMGGKFMTLTWATTVLLLVNMGFWILLFFLCGRKVQEGFATTGGEGFSFRSFKEEERSRPDRTSKIAMLPISQPRPVHDRNGVPMI